MPQSFVSWSVVPTTVEEGFDKKVKSFTFIKGDLVLKKILPGQHDARGKWTSNYEGPYIVKRSFSGDALILTTMDGEELLCPFNSDVIKKYYA